MASPESEAENSWFSGFDEESEDESEDELRANLEFEFGNIHINNEDIPEGINVINNQPDHQNEPENEPENVVEPEVEPEVVEEVF